MVAGSPRRVISGVLAVPLGFTFGLVEGAVRTLGYGVDEISILAQSIFTLIPTKRLFMFTSRLDPITNKITLSLKNYHREFAPAVIEYDSKLVAHAAVSNSIVLIVHLLMLPLRLPYNMLKRGFQRIGTAYRLFSGQYSSTSYRNASEEQSGIGRSSRDQYEVGGREPECPSVSHDDPMPSPRVSQRLPRVQHVTIDANARVKVDDQFIQMQLF